MVEQDLTSFDQRSELLRRSFCHGELAIEILLFVLLAEHFADKIALLEEPDRIVDVAGEKAGPRSAGF